MRTSQLHVLLAFGHSSRWHLNAESLSDGATLIGTLPQCCEETVTNLAGKQRCCCRHMEDEAH